MADLALGDNSINGFRKPFYGNFSLVSPTELSVNKHNTTKLDVLSNKSFTPSDLKGRIEDYVANNNLRSTQSGQVLGHLTIGDRYSSSIPSEFDLEVTDGSKYKTAPSAGFITRPLYTYELE